MKQNSRFISRSLLSATMLFIFATAALAANTRPRPSVQQGIGYGGAATEVVLSDLPDVTAADLAATKPEASPRNPHFTDAQYGAAKLAALHHGISSRPQDAARQLIPRNPAIKAASTDTPGAFIDFFGASQGCNGLGWTPSDMGLAVSSLYVVQVVNECVTVWSKAGALLSGPKDLCGIFGLPANAGSHGCFDPRALYDAQANKFVISASYQDGTGTAYILIAAAGKPSGAWHSHKIVRGAGLADYPTLGQTAYINNPNNSLITVCDNFFGITFYAECLLMPKAGVYGKLGGFPVFFGFSLGGLPLDTLQPANVYELSDNPRAQFAVDSVNYNGGDGFCDANHTFDQGLVVWAFSGATAGQARAAGWYTGCNTSAYSFPGSADNAGFCSACIETLDNRISGMVYYSQGELFPTIDTNNGAASAVLGWKVHPYLDDNGFGCTGGVNCPLITAVTIEQEYCYDCGGGNSFEAYFGDVAPNPENDWVMFATFSGTGVSPGQFYTSNRVSWATPFHDGGIYSCVNDAAYTQGRWGDYGAAAPDDPGTNLKNAAAVWGSGMYVQPSGAWGTCVAGVRPQDGP